MSDLQKYIEKQMEDPEFRIEHEATKAELEKMRKAYQELQYYRKSSPIDRDNKSELTGLRIRGLGARFPLFSGLAALAFTTS